MPQCDGEAVVGEQGETVHPTEEPVRFALYYLIIDTWYARWNVCSYFTFTGIGAYEMLKLEMDGTSIALMGWIRRSSPSYW